MTWTYSVGGISAVVTADNVDLAIKLLEEKLSSLGYKRAVSRVDLVPFVTCHRYVRVLGRDAMPQHNPAAQNTPGNIPGK